MAFTAQALFNRTVGMIGISINNATTYQESFPEQVNTVLSECFEIENSNRSSKDIAVLTTIPTVSALTDSIDYQQDLFQTLAYGLAMYLSLSDDDTVKTQFFNAQYEEAKGRSEKGVLTDIPDYFGEEDAELV